MNLFWGQIIFVNLLKERPPGKCILKNFEFLCKFM